MPTYLVTAPDGRKLRLTGDSPPNKQALDDIFDKVGKKTAAPDSSPLDSPAPLPIAIPHSDPNLTSFNFGGTSHKIEPDAPDLSEIGGDLARGVKEFPSRVATGASLALGYTGNLARGAATDVVMGDLQPQKTYPEQFKNTIAAATGDELPQDKTIREIAPQHPVVATLGKVGQGVLGTAPMLALGGLPVEAGKLLALGFSAEMIKNGGDAATVIGEQMGLPPEQRDMDKLTSAISDLSQTALFAPLAAKFGATDAIESRVRPKDFVIRKLAEQLKSAPAIPKVAPQVQSAGALPSKQDGFTLNQNPLDNPNPPNVGRSPIPRREKSPAPVVPSTPPEAEANLNVVDEIKKSGAKTIADIQRLFPKAQLNREAARKLRDAAYPPNEIKTETPLVADVKTGTAPIATDVTPAKVPAPVAAPEAAVDLNNPDKPQLFQQLKALQNPTPEQIKVRDDLQSKSDAANGKGAFDKANADAEAAKNQPVAPAQSSEPTTPPVATGQSLPELKDNYLKPLKTYTPTLFRETSAEQAEQYFPNTRTSAPQNEHFVANTENLARGQGSNKGVMLEFDSGNLEGQVNTSKPGWKPAYDNGEAEFKIKYATPAEVGKNLKSITVRSDAKSSRVGNIILKQRLADLESKGWTRSKVEDGTKWTRPESQQPPAEHIGEPEKVQSPEQILESNDSVKVKMPKGATMLRVSTESGGKKFAPKTVSKSELEKGNVFKGAGVTKIEAGTMSGKDFVPMKGEVSVEPKIDPRFKGLGAELYGGQKYPPLSQLTDSMSVLAKQSPKTDSAGTAFDFGKSVSEMKNRASEAINGLRAVGQYLKTKAEGYPVWTSFKAALGDRHLALTESVKNSEEFVKESQKTIPDKLTQEAISDYIDAGGNVDLLKKAEAETKDAYKEGYSKAQNLSPEEKALAENARSYFSQRLQDAIDNGILEDGIEDYIHRIYPAESPLKSAILSELRSGIFTGRPALAKQRVYEYDYEAEKAGLKPIKSFIKRIAAYDLSLNKAIADRQIVKAMTQIKMADGRPMVDVGGIGTKIDGTPEKAGAVMIRPSAKTSKPDDKVNDRGDYKSKDFPALKKWKWVSKDGDGNQIFVQGDVLIHPDAVKQVDRLFKRSAIRENPVGRAALAVGRTIKETMLDISGFHPVQITVHGWEHRTFKPVGKIDFDNPDVRGLVRGGLVVGETTGHESFSEGLSGGGSSLTRHIPIIGEKLQAYNHWLFNDYIPRLKVATGLHALERNRAKFPNLPKDELYHLTANQMNNAFGELNYEMIGRSRTMQDVMRLALLAPDFLEARAGFAAQALTKYGSEQRTALLLGAATLYVTARILNKLLDGEYHFEPKNAFSVIYNKKAYSLRTVQGDLLKAAFEPGQFIYSRLNPVYGRTLMEFFSGRDYFGRQRSGLQQLKDFVTMVVPISLKGFVNPREQSIYESFLNAFGVTNRRSTSSSDIFQLADNFKKEHKIATEPGDFVYDSDKDPYYGIKEAAIFSNTATTANEIKKAIKSGHDPKEIWKHFSGYASRPFTGSKAHDAQFYSELSGDNKKIYDDAVKERKLTDSKFKAAWELEGLPPEGGGSAGRLSPLSPLSR